MATLAYPVLAAVVPRRPTAAADRRRRRHLSTSAPGPALPASLLRAVGPDGEWVSVRDTIEAKISAELEPSVLIVKDDSEKHATHKGLHDGHVGVRSNESHFSVVVVSESFQGMNPVKRHRMVNAILQKEFDDGLHALQLSTKTPAEYDKMNGK